MYLVVVLTSMKHPSCDPSGMGFPQMLSAGALNQEVIFS